jgi:hypothetical protein
MSRSLDLHDFPWESEDQRKGYLALVQYWRKNGQDPGLLVDSTAAFFIQKDHESHEWMIEMLDRIITPLRNEIMELRRELGRGKI